MDMIDILEDEINLLEKPMKTQIMEENNKTVQDLKVEMEPIKKTQTEGHEQFRNANRNLEGKSHQQNTRDEIESLGH